jgi:predicted GH43/DUF377 family glycosyl hydrolase
MVEAYARLALILAVQASWVTALSRVPPSAQCARAPPYPECTASYPRQRDFAVSIVDRDPHNHPLIAKANGDSVYAYNLNGAWFPVPLGGSNASLPRRDGLIVRVQEDWKSPNATHPEWTDTGALAAVGADVAAGTAEYIDDSLVFWAGAPAPPRIDRHEWGAIDPRIRYRPKTQEYYLTWDNCTFECAFRSSLLSVSTDPFDHDSWTLVGPVIPGMQTAGVALLFRDDVPHPKHLAFVSSYDCFTILLAESVDGRAWAVTNPTWMQGRPGCWDACGAIAGPQPEVLSSGDFLMIYNIDTRIGRNDTSPLGRCTIGWAILDGADPSRVVARSSTALIAPTLPWEKTSCAANKPDTCQTPYVIFATGLKPLGNDTFLVIYGAGDTDMAAIEIQVDVKRHH